MSEVLTTVPEDTYLFRSESELQQEEKGGYLSGVIKLEGIDPLTEKVIKIELLLESCHPSKLHCNLFRISGKHCLNRENGRKTNKEQQNMSTVSLTGREGSQGVATGPTASLSLERSYSDDLTSTVDEKEKDVLKATVSWPFYSGGKKRSTIKKNSNLTNWLLT